MMRMIHFSRGKILQITHAGMVYLDDDRQAHYLDFVLCSRRWLDYMQAQDTTRKINPAENNCIGQRDVLARPAFMLLFDAPQVRFVFRSHSQAWELEHELRYAGWATLDMN